MTMRLVTVIAVLVAVELGVFYWRHQDVVRLSVSRATVVADTAFPDAARAVLARDRISRRVLERVADVARERREFDLQLHALQRIAGTYPEDGKARLRLAQALRDAGRLDEAERMYRAELGLSSEGGAR